MISLVSAKLCFLRAFFVQMLCFLRAFFVLSLCFLRAKVQAKIVGTKNAWSCKSSCKVFWHEECTIVPKSCKEFRHELCTTCQSRAKVRARMLARRMHAHARPCQSLCALAWHDDALNLWYDAVVWTDKQTKGIQTFHKHKKGTFSVDIIRNWLKFSKSDYLILPDTLTKDQNPTTKIWPKYVFILYDLYELFASYL